MNTNFKVEKGGLDDFNGKVKALDPNSLYAVDFSKMESVNDMVLILASMGIGFPGNHPNIEKLKPFLNLENPFPIPNTQPEEKEMKLPKLKKI
jgi:hypothetical protein